MAKKLEVKPEEAFSIASVSGVMIPYDFTAMYVRIPRSAMHQKGC